MKEKLKPKFIQVDCIESKKLDFRQARAVLKYKPDIVILENPCGKSIPDRKMNHFGPLEKPKEILKNMAAPYSKRILKIHPWAKSDQTTRKNIVKLWKRGHQVLMFSTDGPPELTGELLFVWKHTYPCAMRNWVWWVQIYLREKYMARNIRWVLDNYKEKEKPVILIFLQSFHWRHVRFLLKNPSKKEIWEYYFGRFADEVTRKDISIQIKNLNKVFYKYWKKISDFN